MSKTCEHGHVYGPYDSLCRVCQTHDARVIDLSTTMPVTLEPYAAEARRIRLADVRVFVDQCFEDKRELPCPVCLAVERGIAIGLAERAQQTARSEVASERLTRRVYEMAERAGVVDVRRVMRRLQFNVAILVAGLIIFGATLIVILVGSVATEAGKRMTAVILLASAGLFVTGVLASISLIANTFAYERLRSLVVAEAQQEAEGGRT